MVHDGALATGPTPPPFDGERIVGAPVVDIASSPVPARYVTCARCHGHCVAGTRFCKYCGAPLDETPPAARRASPDVPAPVAAAPPAPVAAAALPVQAEPRRVDTAPSPVRADEIAADHGRAPLRADAADARRAADPVGRVPLVPIGAGATFQAASAGAIGPPVHDGGFAPKPPVDNARAALRADPPAAAVAAPRPIPSAPVRPVDNARAALRADAPVDNARAALRADAPVAAPVEPPAPPRAAARPPPTPPPSPPRAEAPSPKAPPAPAREGEPGQRSQVSAMAGSPVPDEPVALPQRAPARWKGGRLVVIVEDGSEGRSFSLAEGQLDIGRTDGDIVLEDDLYVSPRHARIRRLDGNWVLRDLDSTNHVYVRLRKPYPLRDADLLLLGLEVLQFQTVSDGERGLGHAIQHGTLLFGSPATPRRARLCQRTVEGVIRDVYHLFRDDTVIGREVGDIVFTADPFLSRRHAAIRRNPVTSEFQLMDLDSSNGTYVAIRGEIGIADGDFLRIGQHLFRVDLG
jgi:pSer/pThr/pTyr-binding forkhead associated (FHA) protein